MAKRKRLFGGITSAERVQLRRELTRLIVNNVWHRFVEDPVELDLSVHINTPNEADWRHAQIVVTATTKWGRDVFDAPRRPHEVAISVGELTREVEARHIDCTFHEEAVDRDVLLAISGTWRGVDILIQLCQGKPPPALPPTAATQPRRSVDLT